jgi:hypothetical protein
MITTISHSVATLPRHLIHSDDTVTALLTAAHYLPENGPEAALVFAKAACLNVDPGLLAENLAEIAGQLTKADAFDVDPQHAIDVYCDAHPIGLSTYEFANQERDSARACARLTAELTASMNLAAGS